VNLVKFVVAWKEWEQRKDFKKHTTNSPVVHFMIIVAVCQQAFRWTVPSRRYVLSKRWLWVDTSTGTKICQFNLIIFYQDILSTLIRNSKLTAWCLDEKYRSYACDQSILSLDTYRIWLSIRANSAYALLSLRTYSYPLVQTQEQVYLWAHHTTLRVE
jgi:hypothetical protein